MDRRSHQETVWYLLYRDARHCCEDCFSWYNFDHHHSGLSGFTPEQVFIGRYEAVAEQKQRALDARYAKNPERFV